MYVGKVIGDKGHLLSIDLSPITGALDADTIKALKDAHKQ